MILFGIICAVIFGAGFFIGFEVKAHRDAKELIPYILSMLE